MTDPAPAASGHLTAEHAKALSYHPLTAGRADIHEELRAAAKAYAATIDRLCPPSREGSLAFTAVQESLMWANAAVAVHDPALHGEIVGGP